MTTPPIAGYEPLPFGLKHGLVASLAYLAALLVTGQHQTFVAGTDPVAVYWSVLTVNVQLLVITFVATVPVTMLLTRLYWRVSD
jgi:hypothetical protein